MTLSGIRVLICEEKIMKYWEEMHSKWGFEDGGAAPFGITKFRTVYLLFVNAFAHQLGSKVRAIAFDRPGIHNGCMVAYVSADSVKAKSPLELTRDKRLPEAWVKPDKLMEQAIRNAYDAQPDEYLIVRVAISKSTWETAAKIRNA